MTDAIEVRRVDAAFPFFTGKGGLRIKDGVAELAYQGTRPPRLPVAGTIDGEAYRVVASRDSAMTRGFAVVVVEQVA